MSTAISMESVRVEVKIELGHKASCKKTPSPEGFTHDWVVFVRGPESCDISHFVEKVVFYLHESFAKPKRVLKDPPYTVAEAGYGSFFLPVEVFFKNKEEPRKLMFDYDLVLPACGSPPIDNIRSEALTFTNPTEEFRKKLVKGGGIVTSTGTVNGFHSSSLPVNGSTVQQSTDSKDGKMTKIIADSHPTLQLSTPTTESDKNKKGKHEAVVANKTVKMQESVTPGLKRSSSTSGVEDTQPVKKKKKKPDEASGKPNKPLGFIPLELPVAGNEHKEKLDEIKDVKLKIKSLSSKSPANDKKKSRRVSSEVGSGESVSSTSKRRESTSSKKSKKNSPKDDLKQQAKQEEKKVEKITFRRRGSGDSWSSSTSSSSLQGNSSGNKNMALDKLIAEMSEEDDDDSNEVDVCTPFQSRSLQPSVTTQKPNADAVSSPNSTLKNKDSSNKGRTKSSSQAKKSEVVKSKRKNGLKSPKSLKQSPKPKIKDSTQASNGQRNSSSENLIQLYKRLVALKDSNLLQRIADILETTGRFELTETTLDFDLCSLDKTTIKKIESSINR